MEGQNEQQVQRLPFPGPWGSKRKRMCDGSGVHAGHGAPGISLQHPEGFWVPAQDPTAEAPPNLQFGDEEKRIFWRCSANAFRRRRPDALWDGAGSARRVINAVTARSLDLSDAQSRRKQAPRNGPLEKQRQLSAPQGAFPRNKRFTSAFSELLSKGQRRDDSKHRGLGSEGFGK